MTEFEDALINIASDICLEIEEIRKELEAIEKTLAFK